MSLARTRPKDLRNHPEDGGTGRGLFHTADAAKKEAEPGELVAQQEYARAGEPNYLNDN